MGQKCEGFYTLYPVLDHHAQSRRKTSRASLQRLLLVITTSFLRSTHGLIQAASSGQKRLLSIHEYQSMKLLNSVGSLLDLVIHF